MRYFPNKRDALEAHMHKVHEVGNAQTDTSYCTYYQNLIRSKSAHSKIRNIFWSMPGISHKEEGTVLKYQSGTIHKDMQSVSCSPTALVAPSAPAKTVHFTSSQGASIPSLEIW